jgi:hypothetical protein
MTEATSVKLPNIIAPPLVRTGMTAWMLSSCITMERVKSRPLPYSATQECAVDSGKHDYNCFSSISSILSHQSLKWNGGKLSYTTVDAWQLCTHSVIFSTWVELLHSCSCAGSNTGLDTKPRILHFCNSWPVSAYWNFGEVRLLLPGGPYMVQSDRRSMLTPHNPRPIKLNFTGIDKLHESKFYLLTDGSSDLATVYAFVIANAATPEILPFNDNDTDYMDTKPRLDLDASNLTILK